MATPSRQAFFHRNAMSIIGIVRVARRAALIAVVGWTTEAAHTSLSAQQTAPLTRQQRDSAARVDSAKLASMPGMGDSPAMKMTAGMSMPAAVDSSSMSPSMVPDPLGVSMDRMGSGTTWIPDAVSLPSRHVMA